LSGLFRLCLVLSCLGGSEGGGNGGGGGEKLGAENKVGVKVRGQG
jgi:hypothetical protein